MQRICVLLSLLLLPVPLAASDSCVVKVHFLYGSKPKRAYRHMESDWFGGKLGGHVGIEADSNRVLNFVPDGGFHYRAHKTDFRSRFVVDDHRTFWEIFGDSAETVKQLSIHIPISAVQKRTFDSLSKAYLARTPYDYAFWGMRCGAAAYDILAQLGVVEYYPPRKTFKKIFYPKKLRKRLLKEAQSRNWTLHTRAGTERRKWERD